MRALLSILILSASLPAIAKPPIALDDRLTIELIAQQPAIVTPTGVFADVRDNVWAIESNTHFPPKDYKGHPTDRIFVFSGYEQADAGPGTAVPGRGSNDATGPTSTPRPGTAVPGPIDPQTGLAPGIKRTLFADGLMQAASITMTPAGQIYVVCRNEIVYFEDKNRDLKPDELDLEGGRKADRRTLVRLDTKATYPHNGLNGASLSPDGEFLYFCLGLNTGFDYTMIGSDGSKVPGGGEGGSVWRCTPTGGKVERVAIGFWNCHDLTFDAFGRLFAVDNDPDDIGPCRLLDIIEGGDYGWKYKNGRKGVHPFTSWNGELPGTLPMVAPTGEAPSGILAYESDNWPADYRGQLLVTSWGDHTIQRFELKEKGASFTSTPVNIIRGGDDFRPVGITQASDGSVFITDWVDKSYTLHLKGKLWRVRGKKPTVPVIVTRADALATASPDDLLRNLSNPRREIRVAAGDRLIPLDAEGPRAGTRTDVDMYLTVKDFSWPRDRTDRGITQLLWSAVAGRHPKLEQILPAATAVDSSPTSGEFVRLTGRHVKQSDETRGRDPIGDMFQGEKVFLAARQVLLTVRPGEDFSPSSIPISWRNDEFINTATIVAMSRSKRLDLYLKDGPAVGGEWFRMIEVLAARRSQRSEALPLLPKLLEHQSSSVRRVALQWIGEDRLFQFKDNLPDALKAGEVTRDLLAAYLAAQEKLASQPPEQGKPPVERSVSQFAADFLLDDKNDLKLRKVALELVNPADAKLSAKQLVALIEPMGLEAIKAVAWRDDDESQAALRRVAADAKRDIAERREAVLGLARSAMTSPETKAVLKGILFAKDDAPNTPGAVHPGRAGHQELRLDALRALRGVLDAADGKALVAELSAEARRDRAGGPPSLDEAEWAEQIVLAFKANPDALSAEDRKQIEPLLPKRPTDSAGWAGLTAAVADATGPAGKPTGYTGDVEAGRRVFALATGARCYICHQSDGRGGMVGPDLTRVRFAMDHAKLVESIVEPSKEIAPLYVSAVLEMKNGDTLSGVTLNEGGATWISLADATGKRHRVKADDVVSRREEKISVMPEGLFELMSVREAKDLMAYLRRQ